MIKLIVIISTCSMLYSLSDSHADLAPSHHQSPSITKDSLIYWSTNYKLTWSDFSGKIDSKSTHQAITTSNIGLSVENKNDSIIVKIPACFYRYVSWSKVRSGSDTLLKHEQLHFDIAELVARKLRQKLTGYTYSDVKSAYKYVQDQYHEYHGKIWSGYDIYDIQTEHGLIIGKQKEWEVKIAKELKELKTYSSTKVVIKKKKN